jgi:hypothetical protein
MKSKQANPTQISTPQDPALYQNAHPDGLALPPDVSKDQADGVRALKHSYWYCTWVGECPVCGRDMGYKERVYGERPRKELERYKFIPPIECYDGCMDL